MFQVKSLSDEDILANLSNLNTKETKTVALVLLHLIEVGRRKLYAAREYSSLFSYCTEVLKYCEGTAARRIAASRCIENFPDLLGNFYRQEISITTLALISKIITQENKERVLSSVIGKSKLEIEKFIAGYLPAKSIREGIRPLPSFLVQKAMHQDKNEDAKIAPANISASDALYSKSTATGVAEVGLNVEPQNATLKIHQEPDFEIKIKAKPVTVDKLKRVQELRGKSEALGDLLDLLLEEYIEKHSPEARIERRAQRTQKRQKLKIEHFNGKKLGGAKTKRHTRYISQVVRDQLHSEHKGQCAFVARDGTRCGCRRGLQVDHVKPYGMGGSNAAENLRLLCPTHNRLAAEFCYGKEKLAKVKFRQLS